MEPEVFLRIGLAGLLALPIGLDREVRGKPAGVRTHVLVATAAAALGHVSVLSGEAAGFGSDQTRVAAQVVSGIGFMGAGVIFAGGGRVHGLTTAAALFSAMAIGLVAGLGFGWLAFALAAVTLILLGPVDSLMSRTLSHIGRTERSLVLVLNDLATLELVQAELARMEVVVLQVKLSSLAGGISARLITRPRGSDVEDMVTQLRGLPGVRIAAMESSAGEGLPESGA